MLERSEAERRATTAPAAGFDEGRTFYVDFNQEDFCLRDSNLRDFTADFEAAEFDM